MGTLTDHPGLTWLAIALVLAAIEMATLDFFFLMLAIAALGASVAGFLGGSIVVQVVVFLLVSVAGLVLLRPILIRHMRSTPETLTGTAALVGRDAVVLDAVSGTSGRIRLGGEVWSARTADLRDAQSFLPGDHVTVVAIDGATAVVAPSAEPSTESEGTA